jgi:hypothetical protein
LNESPEYGLKIKYGKAKRDKQKRKRQRVIYFIALHFPNLSFRLRHKAPFALNAIYPNKNTAAIVNIEYKNNRFIYFFFVVFFDVDFFVLDAEPSLSILT